MQGVGCNAGCQLPWAQRGEAGSGPKERRCVGQDRPAFLESCPIAQPRCQPGEREPVAVTLQVNLLGTEQGGESIWGRKWSKRKIPAQRARAMPSKRTGRCDDVPVIPAQAHDKASWFTFLEAFRGTLLPSGPHSASASASLVPLPLLSQPCCGTAFPVSPQLPENPTPQT